jgi:hypothetical protein
LVGVLEGEIQEPHFHGGYLNPVLYGCGVGRDCGFWGDEGEYRARGVRTKGFWQRDEVKGRLVAG